MPWIERKLTIEQAQEVVGRYIAGENFTQISKHYLVSPNTISGILKGVRYKEIILPEDIKEIINSRKYEIQKSRVESLFSLTDHQMNLINGSLLGDGWISKKISSGNANFCKRHACHISEDLFYLFEELKPYSYNIFNARSTNKINNYNETNGAKEINFTKVEKRIVGHEYRSKYQPIFGEMRDKWYPEGKKIVPKDLTLNPEILATWYVDDGSNHLKGKHCMLYTDGFCLDDIEFLRYRLYKDLNIYAFIQVRSKHVENKKWILRFYSHDYYNFIDMVKPFIPWECFQHKIQCNKTIVINKKRPEVVYPNSK